MGVPTRGSYNGIFLANECKQTRPDDRGCDNEGVCKRYLGLPSSPNRSRPECRGVLQGVCQQRGFVNVVAGDSGAAVGIVSHGTSGSTSTGKRGEPGKNRRDLRSRRGSSRYRCGRAAASVSPLSWGTAAASMEVPVSIPVGGGDA